MEIVTHDIDGGHLFFADDDAFRVGFCVEFALYFKSSFCCRGTDEIDDDAIADERFGTPVHADERKQPVFDFVPFACARWQVRWPPETGQVAKIESW